MLLILIFFFFLINFFSVFQPDCKRNKRTYESICKNCRLNAISISAKVPPQALHSTHRHTPHSHLGSAKHMRSCKSAALRNSQGSNNIYKKVTLHAANCHFRKYSFLWLIATAALQINFCLHLLAAPWKTLATALTLFVRDLFAACFLFKKIP